MTDLIQIDAALSPGNSGGPLLDRLGTVVGVVSRRHVNLEDAQNINYAVDAAAIKPVIDAWQVQPPPSPAANCQSPLGPQYSPNVAGPPAYESFVVDSVMTTFEIYFGAINAGFYEDARARVAPNKRLDPAVWADALSTTFNMDIVVWTITPTSGSADAWVTFTSLQAPDKGTRPGETCTMWSIDYTLIPADDGLMWISRAVGHADGPISQPC